MWKWLEQYFTFTSGERNGIILLLLLSVSVFIIPSVYLYFNPVEHISNSVYESEINAFIDEYNQHKKLAMTDSTSEELPGTFNPYSNVDLGSHFTKREKKPIEYFVFDPNKIGIDEWIRLGFSERQAEIIEKLKAKGIKFRKPEDLKSVYVVGEENYNRLVSYIKIDVNNFQKTDYPKTVYPERKKEKLILDINTADSLQFEMLSGIGPSLASRVIKYRNRLGGFVSKEQIKEVWNFPDSTYQSLKEQLVVNKVSPMKININTADFRTMGTHPYINYTYAKVIDAYRKQHGYFKSVSDLKKIVIINDSVYNRLEPYVTVE